MSCNSWWKWTHSQLFMLILYMCLTFLLTFHLLSVMQIKRTLTTNCFATFWSCNRRCQMVVTGCLCHIALLYKVKLPSSGYSHRNGSRSNDDTLQYVNESASRFQKFTYIAPGSYMSATHKIWLEPTLIFSFIWFAPCCLWAHPPLWEVAAYFNIHQPHTQVDMNLPRQIPFGAYNHPQPGPSVYAAKI